MANLMHRIKEHLLFVELQAGIEGDPALETRPVRELRSRAYARAPIKKLGRSIHQLNRAVLGVHFVPCEIENSGPEFHRQCDADARSSEFDVDCPETTGAMMGRSPLTYSGREFF
jgi:hypothetical protein